MNSEVNNYTFPFASIKGELLESLFFHNNHPREISDAFYPLSVQDENYNNDLNVNQFLIRSRNVNFPSPNTFS